MCINKINNLKEFFANFLEHYQHHSTQQSYIYIVLLGKINIWNKRTVQTADVGSSNRQTPKDCFIYLTRTEENKWLEKCSTF